MIYGYGTMDMVWWLQVSCLTIVLCCVELGVWLWWVVGHRGEYVGVYLPRSQDTLQSRTLTQLAICNLNWRTIHKRMCKTSWRHHFHVQARLRHVAQDTLTVNRSCKVCNRTCTTCGQASWTCGEPCGQFVLDTRDSAGQWNEGKHIKATYG
jgi:hypothetical protein